jgi:hypothetical protein
VGHAIHFEGIEADGLAHGRKVPFLMRGEIGSVQAACGGFRHEGTAWEKLNLKFSRNDQNKCS